MAVRPLYHEELTELPLGLPGRLYRSPMPFGDYDRSETLFAAYMAAGISGVVVLAEADECLRKTGFDLLAFYERQGLEVIHLPTGDYSVPEREKLDQALAAVEGRLRGGRTIAVHCSAGIGRTGTFLACLAQRVLGLDGEAAMRWVREYIPGAVEMKAQEAMVRRYAAEGRENERKRRGTKD